MTDLPEQPAPNPTGLLLAHGRIQWKELAAVLRHAHGTAWADYSGFHLGAAPTSPPPYTHLWAWNTDWLLRARLDGDTAITGTLHTSTTPVHLDLPTAATETATYTHRHAETWPGQEKRVGPLDPTLTGRNVTLYETGGTTPITFIAITTPPEST